VLDGDHCIITYNQGRISPYNQYLVVTQLEP
jgi:hypothetical protein